MPFDPISLVSGGLQSLVGAGQAIFGAGKARRTQQDLEGYANSFQPNQSIMDYYNKSLSRYNSNPYQTQQFQQENNLQQRNLATGLGFAQDRRGGLASIGRLTQQANDASSRSASQAEAAQGQNLSRLGQAAGMKTAEDQKKFDMIYNLKAAKAGQAASTVNSGIKNIFGGLSTLGAGYMSSKNGGNNTISNNYPIANNYPRVGQNYNTADYQIPQ